MPAKSDTDAPSSASPSLCRHGYPLIFRRDHCSCGGEPELAFAPCPEPRTFAFLVNMRDARAALRTAERKLKSASAGFPNEAAQRSAEGWPHPSTMLGLFSEMRGDTTPPTTGAGCLIWGAALAEQVGLGGAAGS